MHEALLGHISFFASLPPSELQQLAATLKHYQFPPDTILLREGEAGDHFYVVLDGEVEIVKTLRPSEEHRLSVLGSGEFVGEMSLLNDEARRTATVRTRTAVQVLKVTHADFDALLHRHPRLAYEMVKGMSRRLRDADNATIHQLQEKNRQLVQAYQELQAAQASLIAQERIEQELRIARRIQQTLLPQQGPALPGWAVATHYQPAHAVGGDFYDFLTLPSGHLGLVVGDVSDKGVPEALLMATTRSILRGIACASDSPAWVLAQANDLLCPDMPASMFVTCLYAILEPANGRLHYANAGHVLPYRRHDSRVDELGATGLPLGLWPGVQYEEKETVLLPGDSMLFTSDGLVEAHNPQREMFSHARLYTLLANHPALNEAALIDLLLAELARFTGATWEQEDDLMLVTLARTPASTESPIKPERGNDT